MAQQRFMNNARTRLASSITSAQTAFSIEVGTGDLFPVASQGTGSIGDFFEVTLEADDGYKEIIKVRTRAAGSDLFSDCIRGEQTSYGGQAARDWDSGTVIGLRLTAKVIEEAIAQDWSAFPVSSLADSGGSKTLDKSGDYVNTGTSDIVIPASTFSKGSVVIIFNNDSAAHTITPDTGVTLEWSDGATGVRTLVSRGLAALVFDEPNVARIVGDGVE